MLFYPVLDSGGAASQLLDMLDTSQDVVITSGGRPRAIVTPVTEYDFQETVKTLAQARALRAIREMRRVSATNGNDKMTLADINAEIAAARREMASN